MSASGPTAAPSTRRDFDFCSAECTVERATRVVGTGKYSLGAGPSNPNALTPFNRAGACDCSAFVCWALGVPKHVVLDEGDGSGVDWWNTDGLLAEARAGRYFRFVEEGHYLPGDVVVYPSVDLDRDGARDRIGHTGVIVSGGPLIAVCEVVHCRPPRNGKGPAVVRTTGDPFIGKATYRRVTNQKWRARVIRPVR